MWRVNKSPAYLTGQDRPGFCYLLFFRTICLTHGCSSALFLERKSSGFGLTDFSAVALTSFLIDMVPTNTVGPLYNHAICVWIVAVKLNLLL